MLRIVKILIILVASLSAISNAQSHHSQLHSDYHGQELSDEHDHDHNTPSGECCSDCGLCMLEKIQISYRQIHVFLPLANFRSPLIYNGKAFPGHHRELLRPPA